MVVGQHNITHSSHSTVVQCKWCGARHRVPGLGQHATLTFYQMTFVSWNWCLMELELLRSWWSCVLVMIGAQWYLVVPGTHHGHICQLRLSWLQSTFQCRSKEASICTPRPIHTKSRPITMNTISILYDITTLQLIKPMYMAIRFKELIKIIKWF